MKQAADTKNESNSNTRFNESHPSKTIAYDKEMVVKFQNGRYYFGSWEAFARLPGPLSMNPVPKFGTRCSNEENMNLARSQ